MLLGPPLGYKLLMIGLLFVLSVLLALAAGVRLITGNLPPHISVGESVTTIAMGLIMAGVAISVYLGVKKGKL